MPCHKPLPSSAKFLIAPCASLKKSLPALTVVLRLIIRLALYHYCDTILPMLIRLNPSSGVPIYLQIVQQIRHSIEIGALTEGDQLPAIRTLAEEIIVSPNTVVKAYDDLEQEGLIRLRQGAGAYVEKSNLTKSHRRRFQEASVVVKEAVRKLRSMGLSDDESRRLFEAEWVEEAAAR